jgi:carbon monoxide dehydrogenase subunit G
MKLENEFSVDAPLEQTWATLLDIERVARCLPGARLESNGSDGVYRGEMQLKLGPMTLAYKGTARLAEVEEDEHSATIEARAKEARGAGTAMARIRNQLTPGTGGSTHVRVETDLNITGRPAQFGRGIMEDVASRMLADFAQQLEREILSGQPTAAGGPPAGEPEPRPDREASPPPADAPLDVGAALAGPIARRAGVAVAAVMLLGLLAAVMRRRRRGLVFTVVWR